MLENNSKDFIKESKRYLSISTRLPRLDLISFRRHCDMLNLSPSERIRDLILKDISQPTKQFLSGANIIEYNRLNNNFSWFVELDTGIKNGILDNLSLDFLKNLQNKIHEAIQERNQWVHHSNPGSVDIPKELVGGKDGPNS